nr:MAG TPA: hypothetical protein [Caudoviricetes sp.]
MKVPRSNRRCLHKRCHIKMICHLFFNIMEA